MLEDNAKRIKKEQTEPSEELISTEMAEFISSERTSSQIADICLQNGVENEVEIEKVSYRIALVILGALPKENLTITLENGVGLDAQTAKKISAQTNQLIFSRIPGAQAQAQPLSETKVKRTLLPEKKSEEDKTHEEPSKPLKKDAYHEPVE